MSSSKIAIIPARSGSKGLPNKNILMLVDKPLIAYTIEAALESKVFSKVIVSTDSLEYKSIAEYYGAEVVMRSAELASDTATSFMVIDDVIKKNIDYECFVLLQPTSPFRNAEHIKEAVYQFDNAIDTKFLVSVSESSKCSQLIKPIDDDLSMTNFDYDFSNYRRQNSKDYSPNGAIFIGIVKDYLKQKNFFGSDSIAYVMNKRDSIDIDDQLDFEIAIMVQNKKNKKATLRNAILKRIGEKKEIFNSNTSITLVGHSIFDYWNVNQIKGMTVSNLGIAGINSEEYFKYIFEQNTIKKIGNAVLLLSGTNDIVGEGWNISYTIEWTSKIIEAIKNINQEVHIYFLEVPPVRGRIDRSNATIRELNKALKNYVAQLDNVTWVSLSQCFFDRYGNINQEFTEDGLHFTNKAYAQLKKDIEGVLK